jgi:hypothetical protein
MLPTAKQRVLITVLAIAAGIVYLYAGRMTVAAQGATGCSVLFSATPMIGALVMIAAAVVGLVAGAIASSAGNPLAGTFIFAVALCFPAVANGSIEGWIQYASVPGAYWLLAVECVFWAVLVQGVLIGNRWARARLRRLIPSFACSEHFHDVAAPLAKPDSTARVGSGLAVMAAVVACFILQREIWHQAMSTLVLAAAMHMAFWFILAMRRRRMALDDEEALAQASFKGPAVDGLLAAVSLGTVIPALIIRSPDVGQVIAGLSIGFVFASFAARQLAPGTPTSSLLLNPLFVGASASIVVAMSYDSGPGLRDAMYTLLAARAGTEARWLLPLALAMPVHYASAGVAGSVLGMAWSQAVYATHRQPAPAVQS